MAFRDINPRKFAFLISHGTHEGELRKFFIESKQQLLMKGAKVQNLPHGREERTRTICEKLTRKTDDILRNWFQLNVSVAAPTSLDEVLMYLEASFDEKEQLPEAEALTICRSALSYLFDDTPDARLLALLKRPMGVPVSDANVTPQNEELPPTPVGDSDSSDSSVPHDYQLAELIASIIRGDEGAIDNALAPFSDGIRILVDALLRLRSGDTDAAREQLTLLPSSGPESELVQSALAQASHLQATSAAPVGIRAVIPRALDSDPRADRYEMIGIYMHETSSGAVFVEPLFLVMDNQLHHLSKEDRLRLFPESGSVMSHKSSLRWPFKRGNLVRWNVSERDGAEGKTRFHMNTELSPPISIVRVPVPSSDADEVRDRIKAHASSSPGQIGHQAIFLLSDNVAVASPKGTDYTRDDAFEQPWQAWSSLETWLIEGYQYCLDLPKGDASNLDLSPLEIAFRRLLRDLESETKLTLSKAQRREVAELIRSRSGGEISHRAKRIAASVDQISINAEDLDVVLNLLGSHTEVRHRVEELVAQEFELRQADKTGLQSEIAALRKKKAELEKEGREIERNNRQQAESVATSVRDAFDRAMREGSAALANAEIFQILSTAGRIPSQKEAVTATADQSSGWIKRGALSASHVRARLSALGMNGRQASILSALSDLAGHSGVALTLKGSLARECAKSLVRQNRDSVAIVDIPMGLTSGDLLRRGLSDLTEAKGFALLNADLSPFEVYGAALLDSLIENAVSETPSAPLMVLSCLGGDLSLALPNALRRVSLVVDLDSNWDMSQHSLDEIDPDKIALLPALQKRAFDAASSLDTALRQQVERALALAICVE